MQSMLGVIKLTQRKQRHQGCDQMVARQQSKQV
jgi:hypothetical protein